MSFLSIDDILAEEERVPCTFCVVGRRLGHLDPTAGSGDVEVDSRLELPLWMAEKLAVKQLVAVDLPRNFSAKVREAMLANPENVRLRERSPYFYEAGLRLSALSDLEEAKSLPLAIQATLAVRVMDVLVKAQHASERVEASKFLEPMTDLEQSIFWSGYHCLKEYQAWRKAGKGGQLGGSAAGSAVATVVGTGPGTTQSALGGAFKRKRSAMAGASSSGAGGGVGGR